MKNIHLVINKNIKEFIESQKIFFVGTATCEGRVNVSPKGMDTLRIVGDNRVVWLNLTGSGNETAAQLRENNRMTLMLCAFEGDPLIVRLYGFARVIHPRDSGWLELISLFPSIPGKRQVIDMNVDLVRISCGKGVPIFQFKRDCKQWLQWAIKLGDRGSRIIGRTEIV